MTLTVQDLVTKFDDFADDAKVEIRRLKQDESSTVVHNVVGIRKGDNGNVILTTEFASISCNLFFKPIISFVTSL